ncbi:MAG: PDZ domain-containing protein, partial [Bacillota bacterium]|nr:PDZ domain-containing protein [Bacillota bacterium]
MNRRRRLFILGAFLLALLLIWAGGWRMARAGEDGDWRKALEVMVLVKLHYVDPVSLLDLLKGYMEKGTINGMLAVLHDPYTRYLDPRAYQEMKIDTTGEFGGIGIYVGANKERQIIVVAPIEGTPASRAGIKAGDIIVAIDGRSTEEMS